MRIPTTVQIERHRLSLLTLAVCFLSFAGPILAAAADHCPSPQEVDPSLVHSKDKDKNSPSYIKIGFEVCKDSDGKWRFKNEWMKVSYAKYTEKENPQDANGSGSGSAFPGTDTISGKDPFCGNEDIKVKANCRCKGGNMICDFDFTPPERYYDADTSLKDQDQGKCDACK